LFIDAEVKLIRDPDQKNYLYKVEKDLDSQCQQQASYALGEEHSWGSEKQS